MRVLLLVLLFVPLASTAHGQFVRIGPAGGVSVRAPFVRVEVGPGGETWVRAPFTSVYAPGFGYATGPFADRYGRPRATVVEPAAMDWAELRRELRSAAARLDHELDRRADGPALKLSLQPGALRDLVAARTDRPPDEQIKERLREIQQAYDATDRSAELTSISRLPGFRRVRVALTELLTTPITRQRRQLAASAAALTRALARFATGAGWQHYFQLPAEVFVEDAAGEPDAPYLVAPDLAPLEKVLARFDLVRRSGQYRTIAALPSFASTHARLDQYLALLKDQALSDEPTSAAAEELPAPSSQP